VKNHRQVRDIDAQIGHRIREARHAQSMSQTLLADRVGITFQQVQKYEKGSNRVSAGRLFDIAKVLGMPITYFYEDAEPLAKSVQRRRARTTTRPGVKNL
jgi:transcriptional regulator with XRE-family HTH domain